MARRALAWVVGILAGLAVAFVVLRPSPGPPESHTDPAGGADKELLAVDLTYEQQYPELTEIGTWLRDYVGPQTVIYAGEPVSVRAAGAVFRPLPRDSYENTLNTVVREKGDFVIIHQQVAATNTPSLVPLVTDKSVAFYEPRLSVVKLINNPARNAMVFRVVRPGGPDSVRTEKVAIAFSRFLDHSDNHAWHGELAMRKGLYRSAAMELGHALAADSTNAEVLGNRAFCLLKIDRRLDLAEKHARAAVALAPDNAHYLDTLIQVLRAVNKTEEAAMLEKKLASMGGGADDDSMDDGSGEGGRR